MASNFRVRFQSRVDSHYVFFNYLDSDGTYNNKNNIYGLEILHNMIHYIHGSTPIFFNFFFLKW